MDASAVKAMMAELAPVIREYVDLSLEPYAKRLEAIEARQPERGERGEPGIGIAAAEKTGGVLVLRLTDGSSLDVGNIDGRDGEPGPSPDPEAIAELVRGIVAEPIKEAVIAAVAELPPAERGEKGEPGPMPEPEAVAEAFRELAENIVSEAVAAGIAKLPPPEKGEKGDQGEPGADGANGCGIADLLVDRDGNLVATFEDGRMRNIGPVQGNDGKDGRDGLNGRDGVDGFGFDDLTVEQENERNFKLVFTKDDRRKEFAFTLPVPLDRGVFKQGETYSAGDTVTWGGSLWIAQRETNAKPDTPDSGFRLAVKRGRDGKDAKIAG